MSILLQRVLHWVWPRTQVRMVKLISMVLSPGESLRSDGVVLMQPIGWVGMTELVHILMDMLWRNILNLLLDQVIPIQKRIGLANKRKKETRCTQMDTSAVVQEVKILHIITI